MRGDVCVSEGRGQGARGSGLGGEKLSADRGEARDYRNTWTDTLP